MSRLAVAAASTTVRALLLCLLMQSTAQGADKASGAWTLLYAGSFQWQQRLDRLSVARDLQRRVATLRQQVPPQSPAELAQVDKKDRAFTEQMAQQRSRLFLSTAYQHRELVRNLDRIHAALACVREVEQATAGEMACWADAAAALLQEEQMRLALNTLRKARRLPRKRDTAVIDRDPDLWYAQFGRGILTFILQPYLAERARRP
ncbi:MAG: hypothetical protein AB8B93_00235 [Pseudomonadales bacterium]